MMSGTTLSRTSLPLTGGAFVPSIRVSSGGWRCGMSGSPATWVAFIASCETPAAGRPSTPGSSNLGLSSDGTTPPAPSPTVTLLQPLNHHAAPFERERLVEVAAARKCHVAAIWARAGVSDVTARPHHAKLCFVSTRCSAQKNRSMQEHFLERRGQLSAGSDVVGRDGAKAGLDSPRSRRSRDGQARRGARRRALPRRVLEDRRDLEGGVHDRPTPGAGRRVVGEAV